MSQINFALPERFCSGDCRTMIEPAREIDEERDSLFSTGLLERISSVACAVPVGESEGIELAFRFSPVCNLMRYPIETVSQSETDYEAVRQGTCLLVGWEIYLENWTEWKGAIQLNIRDFDSP